MNQHYLLLTHHNLIHDRMYPISFTLDDLTILDETRGPFYIYPVPLLAFLNQVFFDKVPPCVPMQCLHIRQLNPMSTSISNQVVFVDFEAPREIEVGK